MTEMVYGSVPVSRGEPVFSKWWRTVDKWTLSSVFLLFSIGILLGFAASPPLAEKNGFSPFHYVERQMIYGTIGLTAMVIGSMLPIRLIRRLGVLGFGAAFVAVALLPYFGTDFGKGSVRWYALGFASLQPSEFLKPGFIVVSAWLMAASEHFARRIDGFLSPDLDPNTQLGYATNAIQEGGFFGVGVGEGQVKWSLPDAHTDFIIAVAAEEYGFVLVSLIIAIYAGIVVCSLLRLMRERDSFVRLAGAGLVCMFTVQAVINIGVAVRLLPAKGMTLPFVSCGGSSLIAGGIAMGMLLAFTRSRPQKDITDAFVGRRG